MKFEWDNAKATENQRKHGVDLTDAIPALQDPNRLEEVDEYHGDGEERTIVIGMAVARVLFVITTDRGAEACRIISARRATRHEEDQYYAGDRETW